MTLASKPVSRRQFLIGGAKALSVAAVTALAIAPARAEASLRIGIQKGGSLFLLRERGELAKALGPLGFTPTFTEFPGGPQLLEALNVGSVDFGHTGEAPPIFAQAAGAPLVYVGAQPPAPQAESIVVQTDSPIGTVAQLKGKRVALNRGSNVHYLLVQALAAAGLTLNDVTPVYLPPADARAAFDRGSVDAWVIWDPFLAAALAAGNTRVLQDARGLAPNREFQLASRKLADQQPDVVRAILSEVDRVDRWASSHQPEAARILAPAMGLPVPVLESALSRRGYGVLSITPEIIADQQKVADTFAKLRLIPSSIDVSAAVWKPQA
jgi:sulfonate transport system substrate-binding protein